MRTILVISLFVLSASCEAGAQDGGNSQDAPGDATSSENVAWTNFGEAHQFLFFAVLEGLYEDGVSSADVAAMIHVEEGQSYTHFIANCPICNTVLQAMKVYAARFEIGTMYKGDGYQVRESTFGPGLSGETQARLASDDPKVRLKAIYQLVSTWFNRRLERVKLSNEERARLMEEIEAGKARGLRLLQGFKKQGEETVRQLAPAFVDVEACAMCSAASQEEFEGLSPMGLAKPDDHPFVKKVNE